jgi:hypothetical protein
MTLRAAFPPHAVPLLAVLLAGTASAQSPSPPPDADARARAAVEACSRQISDAPVGLPAVEQRCPDLPAALESAGIRPLIIDSSRAVFDVTSLRQLRVSIRPPGRPAPTVAALGPILRGLRATPVPPPSLWQRMWDWLAAHLTPNQDQRSVPAWLTGILRLLPKLQWVWTGIIWATCIALPVAVVILVMREMRAMGRRSLDDPAAADPAVTTGRAGSRLALLRQMPPGQRPAQLFAMLISRLVAAGRLPPDRSLTHREVVGRVVLDDAEQRRLIDSLARLSERQLYSGSTVAPAGLEELLARGEDLYITGWGRPAEP